ncbi:unnamed protein product [Brassica oleracea]
MWTSESTGTDSISGRRKLTTSAGPARAHHLWPG